MARKTETVIHNLAQAIANQVQALADDSISEGQRYAQVLKIEANVNTLKTMELDKLVQAVKAHAKANYTAGGWDVIVECYEDGQIAEKLTEDKATTVSEAITSFQWMVDVWAERQADARISAGCTCTDQTAVCHCHE